MAIPAKARAAALSAGSVDAMIPAMTTLVDGPSAAFEPEFLVALRALFEERIAFNRVIGLRIDRIEAAVVTGHLDMRPDLIGHDLHQRLHGGVIGTALDAIAGAALMAAIGARHRDEPPAARMARFVKLGTIDLRIDYLRPATGSRFELRGDVLRLGSRIGSARMEIADADGRLLATGNAAYIVG